MWLHVPRTCLSAPEEADSTPDYDLLCRTLSASVTWREKQLKPASWRRALARAGWTMRLSGLTSSPSMLDRGAASWTASLAASRANHTATQASAWESTTNATSGPSSPDWYTTLRRRGASLRTYQASLLTTTEPYDPTYLPWVTRLRRESSQRRRSARHTYGSASSSWPTAMAADDGNKVTPASKMAGLIGAVQNWPTPQSADGERQSATLFRGDSNPTLLGAAKNWPTPSTAPEAPNSGSNTVNGPTSLGEAATLWQTPDAGGFTTRRQQGKTERDELLLAGQAKAWATPTSHDGRRPGPEDGSTQGRNLKREAEAWATPAARDPTLGHEAGPGPSGPSLPEQVHRLSHQAQATETDGQLTSQQGRVLNPRFVEMLMGWPLGATDYESSAMELSLWWQHMRGCLSRLGWEV